MIPGKLNYFPYQLNSSTYHEQIFYRNGFLCYITLHYRESKHRS